MESRSKDIDPPMEGTCEWLLLHKKYKEWVASDRGLLWIKGKPGSGKSTLLRYALSDAMSKLGDGPLILSFFFHGRGVELQKTPLGFLRSLIHQLLRYAPGTLSDLVTTFHNRCKNMGTPGKQWQWHLRELQDFFKSSLWAVLETSSVWLFVDALDECGKRNAIELARGFKSLLQESPHTNSKFHICFTCRHYPVVDLRYGFEICPELENKEAIFAYVQNQLSAEIASAIPRTILEKVTKRASGVFMWTCLVTQRIIDRELEGIGWGKIEAEINDIPDDLDHLYHDLVNNMPDKAASLKLIQWICFAKQPLSLKELQWAMIIDIKSSYQSLHEYRSGMVDEDKMKRQIQTLSSGLAEVVHLEDKNGHTAVQFIHQSVNDFFVKKGLLILDNKSESIDSAVGHAHYQLSRTCIRVFSMKEVDYFIIVELDIISPRWRRSLENITSQYPFLIYATKWWMEHERESTDWNSPQNDLLEHFGWPSEKLAQLWARVHFNISDRDDLLGERAHLIHIVSFYQLIGPLQVILERVGQMPTQRMKMAIRRYYLQLWKAIKLLCSFCLAQAR
ncbi:hypothetical protein F4824DRAFT_433756 [Ustulina deusta]|nr:hypothetical protein F4824DRAFT_433756 [Ustulina deusta]